MEKIKSFVKNNRKEFLILVGILVLASILRFYRLPVYLTFLGDEGRDAIVVRRLLLFADPILVGPGTSIGNMYLGPLYYYFMAPWLWLWGFSPVGPAFGVAILGVITVFLVWFIARDWFGKTAAIIASLLYAISPVVIIYSKSSWNPNIMPFFALLSVYSVWRAWWGKSYRWYLVTAVCFAFVMQSHYLGLLLMPVLGIFWILALYKSKSKKSFAINSALAAGIFAFLMSPLVIFDGRHGWRNFEALKKFFFERQTTVSAKPWNSFPKLLPLAEQIVTRLVAAKNHIVGYFVLAALFVPLFWLIKYFKKIFTRKDLSAFLILYLWFGFALVGFGLYKQEIYDHYFGFIFPVPFLILAGLCQLIADRYRIRGTSIVVVGVLVLVMVNFLDNPFLYSPNRQLQRTEDVAEKIIEYSQGAPFNLAVIAERNYDDAYQYFLENGNAKMVDIDPQKADETITQQLFVVCELPKEKCDPTHSPKAEVANFGWSKIDSQWEESGVVIYKLIHSR
jgi:4-amino-4-deoxy-L-arabinose transferase-like glycosyltransferase